MDQPIIKDQHPDDDDAVSLTDVSTVLNGNIFELYWFFIVSCLNAAFFWLQSELNEKLRQCLEDKAELDDFHALDSEEEADRTTLEDFIRDIKEHIQDRKLAKLIASEEQDPFEDSDQHPEDDEISLTDVRTDIYGNIYKK